VIAVQSQIINFSDIL